MASVEPQERARELDFLLRMLTEGAPPDTSGGPEMRSLPAGEWVKSPIGISSADAINIAISILGAKGPKAAAKMSDAELASEVQKLVAKGHGERGRPQSPYEHPYDEGMAQSIMDDLHWNFEKPQIYAAPAPGPSSWPMAGTPTRGPVLPPQDFPRQQPIAPGPGTPATATPAEILKQIKEKGGYTVNLETGEVPASGIMAGKFANKDPRTRVIEGDPSMVDITSWAKQNEKVLKGPKADFAGFWHDKESGKTYLDVAKRFEPGAIRPATKFAEKTKQISMYDIGKDEFPPVGDYPGFVSGKVTPEGVVPYSRRMHEMGQEGAAYMADKPTVDWWETPDIQRVYGEGTRPQQAGFMAATSGNTKPPPNVQAMTEYMRRMIKGEPIVQPEFRVPETAMGGVTGPGKRMPMEAMKGGRGYNLEAAARGDLDAMRGEVVREKTQALMGDPLAIVLDRVHVRLTEAPKAGVYATAEEGVTPVGADRQVIKDAMAAQAKIEGKNPRQFSADVWTGIREHIKRTGELYGTPYAKTKAGTASSASKSYNDLFVDLIAKKAKHLGISVKAMELRLKTGDGELLSWLLATPVGAELYKLSRGAQSEVVPPPGDVAP